MQHECLQGSFSDNRLVVNPPGCSPAQQRKNELRYTFLNPGVSTDKKPKIMVTTYVGEAPSNMFAPNDSSFGSMACPGFSFRGQTCSGGKLVFTLTYEEDIFPLAAKDVYTLVWSDIISTAVEGICSVQVDITGLGEGADGSDTCRIFKSLAQTEISYFEAEPAVGYPGQTVTLKWKVENVEAGYILPGGYDIFAGGAQSSSSLPVVLQRGVDSYFLYASGQGRGVYREADVFLRPPSFSLKVEGRKATWECHFSQTQELAENGEYKKIDVVDGCTLNASTNKLALRCKNEVATIEEIWSVSQDKEILCFQKIIHTYGNHKVVGATWQTTDSKKTTITVWDTRGYEVAIESGYWEQAYALKANVSIGLRYKREGMPELVLKL